MQQSSRHSGRKREGEDVVEMVLTAAISAGALQRITIDGKNLCCYEQLTRLCFPPRANIDILKKKVEDTEIIHSIQVLPETKCLIGCVHKVARLQLCGIQIVARACEETLLRYTWQIMCGGPSWLRWMGFLGFRICNRNGGLSSSGLLAGVLQ
ncbi:hypothetical protein Nepgr_025964 [Nepenthes gracilis]|uniref:Uncharacterized protein n=1 Tax=Nepenthes gracilis TaxID=150966 RepID=A0AAD3Y213_NEPGR|nr:hypothetical protein Nepgr_025964 [Nepenthes gracilis]